MVFWIVKMETYKKNFYGSIIEEGFIDRNLIDVIVRIKVHTIRVLLHIVSVKNEKKRMNLLVVLSIVIYLVVVSNKGMVEVDYNISLKDILKNFIMIEVSKARIYN